MTRVISSKFRDGTFKKCPSIYIRMKLFNCWIDDELKVFNFLIGIEMNCFNYLVAVFFNFKLHTCATGFLFSIVIQKYTKNQINLIIM